MSGGCTWSYMSEHRVLDLVREWAWVVDGRVSTPMTGFGKHREHGVCINDSITYTHVQGDRRLRCNNWWPVTCCATVGPADMLGPSH